MYAHRGPVSELDTTRCRRDARRLKFGARLACRDEHEVAFRVTREGTLTIVAQSNAVRHHSNVESLNLKRCPRRL